MCSVPSLLLKADAPHPTDLVTRVGGRPLAPAGFAWPLCGECGAAMQFLAQVRLRDADPSLSDRLLLLFACQAPPFLCSSGAPGSSANFAVCVGLDDLAPCEPPDEALHALRPVDGLIRRHFDGAYDDARAAVQPPDFVWGHVGDPADSVSGFVPSCPTCQSPMRFVVQLEQGWDADTAMNFNGVTAFAYVCPSCPDAAAIFVDDFF
jgi:hypothetical protein